MGKDTCSILLVKCSRDAKFTANWSNLFESKAKQLTSHTYAARIGAGDSSARRYHHPTLKRTQPVKGRVRNPETNNGRRPNPSAPDLHR